MSPMSKHLPARLALRELRHDWQAAACFVAALVGVLAPLLILLALKNGVIGAMVEKLVEDPSNREIIAMGTDTFGATFFADMAAREDVEFVLPATRRINASASALRNPDSRALERSVPLIPSASGDPLIPGPYVTAGQVWLSSSLAEDLGTGTGQIVEMLVGRDIDGQRETARQSFEVLGIVPAERYGRQAMFLALDDLLALERFRDDAGITLESYASTRAPPQRYASFRMYARDLSDLPSLLTALDMRGIQVRPRAENATLLLAFRDRLNILYAGIAFVAVAGFWAAMAANLRGMVERQRVTFSLLRMLGLSPRACARIPLIQSAVLVTSGVALTLMIVAPALVAINLAFSGPMTGALARLGAFDIAATLLLGLLTAMSAAIWAMSAVRQIKTDEVLRNG